MKQRGIGLILAAVAMSVSVAACSSGNMPKEPTIIYEGSGATITMSPGTDEKNKNIEVLTFETTGEMEDNETNTIIFKNAIKAFWDIDAPDSEAEYFAKQKNKSTSENKKVVKVTNEKRPAYLPSGGGVKILEDTKGILYFYDENNSFTTVAIFKDDRVETSISLSVDYF